jgi:thiosulfate/3-mercaptopyruvate sulfurtransferase
MVSSPLVSTEWLEQHLGDPDLRILEVCNLDDDQTYNEGHVPGAMWRYWKDACWHESDRQFVTPAAMARMFGAMGIGPQSTLVLYGDPVQFGSYAFWSFTMAGHKNLRLLDGGRRKWVIEGRPLARTVPHFAPVDYPAPAEDASMRIGRRNVRDNLQNPRRLLLDVRSPEEYTGERVSDYSFPVDHGAQRNGRIPGAVHLYYRDLLNEDDSFKSPEALQRTLNAAGIAPDKFNDIVCYCRLSHRATIAWIALSRVLGHSNIKIYDGSWTEWGSIVGYPIEK